MECDVCEREIEPGDAMICVACVEEARGLAYDRIVALKADLANMTAERDALRGILRDVWAQFAIVNADGHRWSGGLSVLDDVRQAIGGGDSDG